jgi:ParB-like chromosome segregation protein Spo0J
MTRQWNKKIVGSADVPPGDLVAHDKNWREHPDTQKQALQGAIDDIGYIRSVTVNKRTGRILDGHLRVKLALETGQETIPVEYVDLTEEEESLALASIDPLAALAEANRDRLAELLQEVRAKSPALTDMLTELAKKQGVLADPQEVRDMDLPPERFEVVISCEGEADQRELFERLTGEGLKCRVITF